MSRQPILELVSRYAGRFPSEAPTAHRLAAFVRAHEDCFERSQLAGHVTGSAWLLHPTAPAALLTHHRKLDIWVQLGGHADGDSDIARVAMREAVEESGIEDIAFVSSEIFDIDIHEIPARKSDPAHFHYDCRFLLRAAREDFEVTDESHDLKWVEFDEIRRYTTEESVLRMVEKSREQVLPG